MDEKAYPDRIYLPPESFTVEAIVCSREDSAHDQRKYAIQIQQKPAVVDVMGMVSEGMEECTQAETR